MKIRPTRPADDLELVTPSSLRTWPLLLILAALLTSVRAEETTANWPSFRGPNAAGVSDGQSLPDQWNAETGAGIRFQVEIPGLAHSSPILWSDRLFVTTAVSSEPDASFKPGLYGSGEASADRSVQEWQILCLDKNSGKILWQKTATKGAPKDKRHIKSTYANSTPATDGKVVVALFGSEGLFAYTVAGEFLWKKDLGRMDVGAYDLPSYEWGTASSPIIHDGKVIVQCDQQHGSFLLAADLKTGETVWKTERDELPSWGTPTVCPGKGGEELVTNSSNFIRGYNPATGAELWRLGGSSKITAPTPVFAEGLIIVSSGRAPERPIFAIRPGGRGDVTLRDGATSNQSIAWSKTRRGGYMPTPLIYRNLVLCPEQRRAPRLLRIGDGHRALSRPDPASFVWLQRLAGGRRWKNLSRRRGRPGLCRSRPAAVDETARHQSRRRTSRGHPALSGGHSLISRGSKHSVRRIGKRE